MTPMLHSLKHCIHTAKQAEEILHEHGAAYLVNISEIYTFRQIKTYHRVKVSTLYDDEICLELELNLYTLLFRKFALDSKLH